MSENSSPPNYNVNDLLTMMRYLRDKHHGCPWDMKQNFDTIAPFTLEETYEVLEAIAKKDHEHLKEELGDLLFQVIFHSQIAEDNDLFQFTDVVDVLVRKMLRRHPHVFPDGTLDSFGQVKEPWSEAQIAQSWSQIKEQEKQNASARKASSAVHNQVSLLDKANNKLSVLLYAEDIQDQAAKVGFDWPDSHGAESKVVEELKEVQLAETQADLEDEIGDLLFACVNLARHKNVNPELALLKANNKFKQRFKHMEQVAIQENVALQDEDAATLLDGLSQIMKAMDLEQLEALWQKAKTTA